MAQHKQEELERKWQEHIGKEKKLAKKEDRLFRQPNFTLLVSSISMQAMIAMGRLKSPVSNMSQKNLEQALFLIETLPILKDKVDGNLTESEKIFLDNSIYHLRENYLKTRSCDDR